MNRSKLAKKVLAGILGAAMLAAVPVSAESTGENNDRIDVTYTLDTAYMLNIPKSITLSAKDSKTSDAIGVSMVNTAPTKEVQVKVKSGITAAYQVELTRENDSATKVVSDVTDYNNQAVSVGSVIAVFRDTSTTPVAGDNTNVLKFSAVKDSQSSTATVKAGKYTGTITFEGSVEDRQ